MLAKLYILEMVSLFFLYVRHKPPICALSFRGVIYSIQPLNANTIKQMLKLLTLASNGYCL